MATHADTSPQNTPPADTQAITFERDDALSALCQQGAIWVSEQTHTNRYHAHTFTTQHAVHTNVIPFGATAIDSHLPHGGLSTCAVHELAYDDPLLPRAVASTIPTVLAYSAHTRQQRHTTNSGWRPTSHTSCDTPYTVWIGKRCWPSPFLLSALDGPDTPYEERLLQRSLFIDPPTSAATLWAIETSLRSRAVHLVVAACPRVSRTTTQRFAHAARTHNTTVILLRAHSDMAVPSCATSRWRVAPVSSSHDTAAWELTLLKLTGAPYQQMSWIVNLQSREHLFSSHSSSIDFTSFLCAHKISSPQQHVSLDSTELSTATGTT